MIIQRASKCTSCASHHPLMSMTHVVQLINSKRTHNAKMSFSKFTNLYFFVLSISFAKFEVCTLKIVLVRAKLSGMCGQLHKDFSP